MKKELKGFICGVVLTALLGCGVSAAGVWDNISVLKNDIKVVVNGESVTADNFLYNDTTYLPLRAVSETLKQPVNYDEATNTAYIGERKDNNTMKSKHTPPQDFGGIMLKDGVYYYNANDADYQLYKTFGVKPEKLDEEENFTITNRNGETKSWKLINFDGWHYIPYDTFVDEILPFVE